MREPPGLAPLGDEVADPDAWVMLPGEELADVPGELGDELLEQPVRRRVRLPEEPTAQERLDHEQYHEPCRAWCPACVAGRGRVPYHKKTAEHGEDAIPVLGIDYGFLTGRAEPDSAGPDSTSSPEDIDVQSNRCTPVLCGRVFGGQVDRWAFRSE